MSLHAPSFILAVVYFLGLICGSATAQGPNASNLSFSASPFSGLASVSLNSRDLFENDPDRRLLQKRQTPQCSIPGGPICDTIHCCPPSDHCCPSGCCPTTSACFRTDRCCPLTSTICPGETACCPAGYSCCGTSCCPAGSICERNECISQTLKDKVVRFDIKKNNREVLKNMCNGMRGKNTETLTYRGPDQAERDRTRVSAGCVPGYCADQIAKGLVPANFDSCDEYPPASSLEGGSARLPLQRAINCIPRRQNSHQGGKFGGFQSKLRKLGANFQRGDQFVISIDCDQVLRDLVPREVQEKSKRLVKRDDGKVSMTENETVDLDVLNDDETQFSYLVAPFGDLQPGTYSVKIEVTSGATVGGFVIDNEGWNFTANDDGIQTGKSQTYSFTVQYWSPGMGVFLATSDNSTAIRWSLDGSLGQPASSASPTPSAQTSGCEGRESSPLWKTLAISTLALICASM